MVIRRVDFHIQDEDGRVLALVESSQLDALSVGETVLVEDYEGNRCKAEIAQIDKPKSLVALELTRGSLEPSEWNDWKVEEEERAMERPPEYERFEDLTRSLLSVPKKDIA